MDSKSVLHIMPFSEEGKLLFFFADGVDYFKALRGEEDAKFTSFCVDLEDFHTIENIVVDFSNHRPTSIRVVS